MRADVVLRGVDVRAAADDFFARETGLRAVDAEALDNESDSPFTSAPPLPPVAGASGSEVTDLSYQPRPTGAFMVPTCQKPDGWITK